MDLLVAIERDGPVALRDQLYDGLRRAMVDGRLPAGSRLPASRALAGRLHLSRFTVEDAYSRLISEGYLEGRQGAGTYVRPDAVLLPPSSNGSRAPQARATPARRWSRWGRQLPEPPEPFPTHLDYSFRASLPGLDAFPHRLWNRALARAARQISDTGRGYGESGGYPPLRQAVAAYLGRSRGLPHPADQLVITSGFQQSLDLLTRILIDPGDVVALEEPGYPGARAMFGAAGATVALVPVDGDGMRVDLLDELSPSAKLVYVTPSHQYPTGSILSLGRRWALLRWAQARGALIVEDDYDAEFRYGARPVPALGGLDGTASDVVVYVGTFSKVLYPSLRLGYAALPHDMVGVFTGAKRIADYHSSTLEQVALAAFIEDGHFERHLARMRRLYAGRRAAMVDALVTELPGIARWPEDAASGLHLLVSFDLPLTERELLARAAGAGVALEAAGDTYATPPARPTVLMGYAGLPEERIRAGVRVLAAALREPLQK